MIYYLSISYAGINTRGESGPANDDSQAYGRLRMSVTTTALAAAAMCLVMMFASSVSGAAPAPKPALAIDAAKVGDPISKYIYGQFIEHLGRCIYDGIWAEMVADRKFFLPVGAKASPWKALNGKAVIMARKESYVGEQTPEVPPAGGIGQGKMGLVKGKAYVGRIRLAGAGPVRVSLVWGPGPKARQTVTIDKAGGDYAAATLRFTAGDATDDARLEIVNAGKTPVRVGCVSLMPADNVHGMRADVLALLKEMDATLYRWPGGNFVSGYDFRDGLGAVDRRPPRKNPAWEGLESNDFGLDEFMTFCRLVGAEPLIVVNSGAGDVTMALAELEYANGGPETPMGKRRAANGHAKPYGVTWWGIGNEMYGRWQIGHMPLAKYVVKHNAFAAAMRKADSRVKLVAVGLRGKWSETMLTGCAENMDLISEHFYLGQKSDLAAHVGQVRNAVRTIANAHRGYRKKLASLKGKDIRIALDEWNYCYSWRPPYVYGQLGHRCYLKDCLGTAAGLNELIRSQDIFFMANYSITVNVIGAVKTTKTAASLATTGLVLKMYRRHFGELPVTATAAPPLDAAAALTRDRKTLTIAVVNPTMKALDIPLTLTGVKLTGTGVRWDVSGTDPKAHNAPGKPPRVVLKETPVKGISNTLPVAPCSVTLYALGVE